MITLLFTTQTFRQSISWNLSMISITGEFKWFSWRDCTWILTSSAKKGTSLTLFLGRFSLPLLVSRESSSTKLYSRHKNQVIFLERSNSHDFLELWFSWRDCSRRVLISSRKKKTSLTFKWFSWRVLTSSGKKKLLWHCSWVFAEPKWRYHLSHWRIAQFLDTRCEDAQEQLGQFSWDGGKGRKSSYGMAWRSCYLKALLPRIWSIWRRHGFQ